MKAVKYLERIEIIDRLIENKLSESEYWKSIASNVSVSIPTATVGGKIVGLERIKSSGISDKMADAVCNYVDIEEAYKLEIGELAAERRDILSTIEKLPPQEYIVIYKRYVEHKQMQEIAIEMCRSRGWVTGTHGKALEDLQAILDEVEL